MNKIFSTVRPILRKSYLDIIGKFKEPAIGIHILNGHEIIHNGIDNSDIFRLRLNELSEYVRFINFEEAVNLINNKTMVDYPLVAFSWDDGFIEHYTHIAPILEEFGVNAAFFINPNFIDADDKYIENFTKKIVKNPGKLPMNWDQIKDLKERGHIIGAHTMDHYMIRNSSNDETLNYQIAQCKDVLESKLKFTCDYFAFPYGRLEQADEKSINLACNIYKYVFSQSDHIHYFSFNGKVINRRHFEPFWPISHIKYFLSCNKE